MVGTTPAGETVTQVSTHVAQTSTGPDGIPLETGAPLGVSSSGTTGTATTPSPTSTASTATTTASPLSTNPTVTGQTIDGVVCSRFPQEAYQTYAHLQVDVDGHPRALPAGIGLVGAHVAQASATVTTYAPGLCSYWLHTRAANGLIQIGSPTPTTFTLGTLFDIWGEPLGRRQVADARGPVTVIVNGRRRAVDPRSIPLHEHEAIELAVGHPVPRFMPVHWAQTDL